jgi:hypothetical protein
MRFILVSQTGNLASQNGEALKLLSATFVGAQLGKDAAQTVALTHMPRVLYPKGMEEGDVFEIEVTIKKVEVTPNQVPGKVGGTPVEGTPNAAS